MRRWRTGIGALLFGVPAAGPFVLPLALDLLTLAFALLALRPLGLLHALLGRLAARPLALDLLTLAFALLALGPLGFLHALIGLAALPLALNLFALLALPPLGLLRTHVFTWRTALGPGRPIRPLVRRLALRPARSALRSGITRRRALRAPPRDFVRRADDWLAQGHPGMDCKS